MANEKLLTVREVAAILGLTEKEVVELAESGTMTAYKVGGVYLRFKRSQVDDYRKKKGSTKPQHYSSFRESLFDFFYFYDFYIFSFLVILILLYIIFK